MNVPLLNDCEHWFLQTLGSEGAVWFWIALVVTTALVGIAGFMIISAILKKLNNWLESPAGWRPLSWSMVLWAGATFIAAGIAARMYQNGSSGWTIPLVLAGLSLIAFVSLHLLELSFWRGIVAVTCNLGLGLVLSPLVQLGICAILILAVLLVVSFFSPRYVVVQ